METKVIAIRHWDDLVFENRNKAYGAYNLRRTYSKRVILGWGVSVAMFAGLLISSQFDWSKEKTNEIVDAIHCTFDFNLQPPPKIYEQTKIKSTVKPPVKSVANTAPLVVSEPVDTEPVANASLISSDGVDTGDPVVEGTPDGIGSTPEVTPVVVPPSTVNFAEHMPEFAGGNEGMIKFIVKNIKYPASARRQEEEGTVYVQFVVMTDGSIEQAEVIRGFHPDCDKEAIRVIQKMPKWIAGSQNGTPVNVRMVVPIKFKLGS